MQRRAFLRTTTATLAGIVLAGCNTEPDSPATTGAPTDDETSERTTRGSTTSETESTPETTTTDGTTTAETTSSPNSDATDRTPSDGSGGSGEGGNGGGGGKSTPTTSAGRITDETRSTSAEGTPITETAGTAPDTSTS